MEAHDVATELSAQLSSITGAALSEQVEVLQMDDLLELVSQGELQAWSSSHVDAAGGEDLDAMVRRRSKEESDKKAANAEEATRARRSGQSCTVPWSSL